MDPMTLAFPPQETRKKFSVTVKFKRQQEAKWVISILLRGFLPVLVVQMEQRGQQKGEMARRVGGCGAWRKAAALGRGWGRLQLQLLREESHQRNSKTQPHGLNPSLPYLL